MLCGAVGGAEPESPREVDIFELGGVAALVGIAQRVKLKSHCSAGEQHSPSHRCA